MVDNRSHLSVTTVGEVKIVEFSDQKILDELCIAEIQKELTQIVDQEVQVKLLLSFSNVDHLSSAALGVLITLNKQVKEAKGTLKLSDISQPIFEVFKITRLNKLFDIHDTAEQALNRF